MRILLVCRMLGGCRDARRVPAERDDRRRGATGVGGGANGGGANGGGANGGGA
jgi:hypothetical protein